VRRLLVLLLAACGGSPDPVPAACPGLLASAAVAPAAGVTLACADDVKLDGFVPLGPAIALGPARATSDRPFRVTLPYVTTARRNVLVAARRARAPSRIASTAASRVPPLRYVPRTATTFLPTLSSAENFVPQSTPPETQLAVTGN